MRTSNARNSIAVNICNSLVSKTLLNQSFYNAVHFSESMQVITGGSKSTLSYVQRPAKISYQYKFNDQPFVSADREFIDLMLELVIDLEPICFGDAVMLGVIADIKESLKQSDLSDLHAKLELINELIYIKSIFRAKDENDFDGYGSDSDLEVKSRSNAIHIIPHKSVITGASEVSPSIAISGRSLASARDDRLVGNDMVENRDKQMISFK